MHTPPAPRTAWADLVLPHRCAGCQQLGPVVCDACRFALGTSPATIVPGGIAAALTFDGVVRTVVHGLKYRNRRAAARVLAAITVRRLGLTGPGAPRVDLVTWAPTGPARIRHRGYDQAELLARSIAAELGVPCRRLLYRVHGPAQSGRGRAERLHGPAFRARGGRGPRVLLVDDVVTTGATLMAAGRALSDAGIPEVRLIAVAATPRPGERRTNGAGASDRVRAGAPASEQAPGRLETA
ncbi:MAG: ComF family protein [Acidimicrobiaceae bacterium]|nr:ComF family protein [Acidimicrobiaceae bacterium]